MNTQLVFARTSKGNQEITSREFQLPQRVRTVLILVDGKSSVVQLREKAMGLSELENTLEDLAIQGFIQTNSPAWDRRVGAVVVKASKYNGVERRRSSADSAFTPIRARLINTTILTFGRSAENVVKKFKDASGDWQGMETAITECTQLAGMVFGEEKAKEFESKCWQILSKALRTSTQRT